MLTFRKTLFMDEASEFERVLEEKTPSTIRGSARAKSIRESLVILKKEYNKAQVNTLRDIVWRGLENTDSYPIKDFSSIQKAIMQNAGSSGKRLLWPILKEIEDGTVRAPIIMRYSGEPWTLVAGNTRLMLCRLLKVQPSVVMMDIRD